MAQASPAACSSAGSSTASTVAGTAKSWRSRSPFSSVQHPRCSHESCSSVQIERFLADSSEHRGSFCRHNHRARGLPPRSMGQPGRARRRQHAAPSLTLAFQSDSGEASSSSASSHLFKKNSTARIVRPVGRSRTTGSRGRCWLRVSSSSARTRCSPEVRKNSRCSYESCGRVSDIMISAGSSQSVVVAFSVRGGSGRRGRLGHCLQPHRLRGLHGLHRAHACLRHPRVLQVQTAHCLDRWLRLPYHNLSLTAA